MLDHQHLIHRNSSHYWIHIRKKLNAFIVQKHWRRREARKKENWRNGKEYRNVIIGTREKSSKRATTGYIFCVHVMIIIWYMEGYYGYTIFTRWILFLVNCILGYIIITCFFKWSDVIMYSLHIHTHSHFFLTERKKMRKNGSFLLGC